jgi:hypothetical protein
MLALTSPTNGGRSVGIVRLRTKATEFGFLFLVLVALNILVHWIIANQGIQFVC